MSNSVRLFFVIFAYRLHASNSSDTLSSILGIGDPKNVLWAYQKRDIIPRDSFSNTDHGFYMVRSAPEKCLLTESKLTFQ